MASLRDDQQEVDRAISLADGRPTQRQIDQSTLVLTQMRRQRKTLRQRRIEIEKKEEELGKKIEELKEEIKHQREMMKQVGHGKKEQKRQAERLIQQEMRRLREEDRVVREKEEEKIRNEELDRLEAIQLEKRRISNEERKKRARRAKQREVERRQEERREAERVEAELREVRRAEARRRRLARRAMRRGEIFDVVKDVGTGKDKHELVGWPDSNPEQRQLSEKVDQSVKSASQSSLQMLLNAYKRQPELNNPPRQRVERKPSQSSLQILLDAYENHHIEVKKPLAYMPKKEEAISSPPSDHGPQRDSGPGDMGQIWAAYMQRQSALGQHDADRTGEEEPDVSNGHHPGQDGNGTKRQDEFSGATLNEKLHVDNSSRRSISVQSRETMGGTLDTGPHYFIDGASSTPQTEYPSRSSGKKRRLGDLRRLFGLSK